MTRFFRPAGPGGESKGSFQVSRSALSAERACAECRGMRWNPAEAAEIVEAAGKAPVYSEDRPWALELHGRSVYLFEAGQRSEHDPLGFDRLLSCGAALEHVVLAIRHAGWHPHVVFPTDQASPDVLAVVRADRRQPPDPQDLDLHRAIRLADAPGPGDAHKFGWANHWAG